MESDSIVVECRVEDQHLQGIAIEEGRAGHTRAELFAPGSIQWPAAGIDLLAEHRGRKLGKIYPERVGNEIRIRCRATPEIRDVVKEKSNLSIEFVCLEDHRTLAGVREVRRAMLSGVALVDRPEYKQARAEIRSRLGKRKWHYL